jgi:hypothetical protein
MQMIKVIFIGDQKAFDSRLGLGTLFGISFVIVVLGFV